MNPHVITTYFAADHDRLDHLFTQFQKTKHGPFQVAKPFFRNFRRGLTRHIIWEEEILFPIFEAKSGLSPNQGPTAAMRHEHRLIQEALERLHDKVRAANPNSDEEERALLDILSAHNQKEENILYPAIDKQVTDKEAADMFIAMEEIPDDRWKNCCGSHHHAEASAGVNF